MAKPLEGIRVLDLTQFLAGPFCTTILHDLGAEVIKVENPPKGDNTRTVVPAAEGTSPFFISINRGKKSLCLNLKKDSHKEIFFKLLNHCDVVVENYKPGTAAKLGISYQDVCKVKPDIVYLSISGYGQTGPYSPRAALDTAIQAASGIMSITGPLDGEPTRCGASVSDTVAGLYGVVGVVSALYHRKETGKGQYIDVAMLDSSLSIMETNLAIYMRTGKVPKPIGNRHVGSAPFQPYNTSDGSIFVCCPTNPQFHTLAKALGCPELISDERFLDEADRLKNIDALNEVLSSRFGGMTTAEAGAIMFRNDLAYSDINTFDKVVENEQVRARKMIVDVFDAKAGKFRAVGSPIKFSSFEAQTEYVSSQVGENGEDILRGLLGMTGEEIGNLY